MKKLKSTASAQLWLMKRVKVEFSKFQKTRQRVRLDFSQPPEACRGGGKHYGRAAHQGTRFESRLQNSSLGFQNSSLDFQNLSLDFKIRT